MTLGEHIYLHLEVFFLFLFLQFYWCTVLKECLYQFKALSPLTYMYTEFLYFFNQIF